MTIRQYFEQHHDGPQAVLSATPDGVPTLWIIRHGDGLTVCDHDAQAFDGRRYRDDSNVGVAAAVAAYYEMR